MLIVETIAKIRRYYFVEKKKIRAISRELNLSRNTVRKVIRSGATSHEYQRKVSFTPKLEDYTDQLDKFIEENQAKSKSHRMTAQRMYELIQLDGYTGAYDRVRRYVKQQKEKHGSTNGPSYIPLQFPPGDAYQFDWSYENVIIGGINQKVKVAHFRLCHSRAFFIRAYPRESQEMVFDAHDKAFSFFNGVCKRGIYDNLKTAVDKVLRGKDRKFNNKFLQLCSHFLVEPVACTPGAGWEKGQVENQVKNVRSWLFTPQPRFASFAELNEWLADQCVAICKKRKHPQNKEKTIWEMYEEEVPFLLNNPGEYNAYSVKEARVSSTSLIRYDRNHYSVDSSVAGKTASIYASAERIKVYSNSQLVADHVRRFSRDHVIYDPWHYLHILKHKPGALRNGAPFQEWILPSSIKQVQRKLEKQTGGDRQFVNILIQAQQHGIEVIDQACKSALKNKTVQGEVIINNIARLLDPSPIDEVTVPASLQISVEPTTDCSRYDCLLNEVCHGAS